VSIQGNDSDIFYIEKKTGARLKKSFSVKKKYKKNNCESFERLSIFLQDNKKNLSYFTELTSDINLTTFEKEQLIEVSCDPSMKNKFFNSNNV